MNFKAIEQAMLDELANPKRCYLPNSPVSFVKSRLQNQGFTNEAVWFWSRVCSSNVKFNIEKLDAIYPKLEALANKERMPEWGTRGT